MSDFCFGWPVFKRVMQHAALMDRMMDRSGVEPLAAVRLDQGSAWYEARTRCIECAHGVECQRWLDPPEVGDRGVPEFCVNANFFDRVRLQQAALRA